MNTIQFNQELLELQDYLEYFARKLTNNQEDARDLVQETYLKALTYREKFVHQTNLKAWLFTIMKNIFINNYRRNVKAKTMIDTTDNLYYLNNKSGNDAVSPDSSYAEKEIMKGIAKLEDEQRIPFEMHTHGYKYKEIAEELEISIGTVKSRIFFGRKKLMEKLHDYAK